MNQNPKHLKTIELVNFGPFPSVSISPLGSLVEIAGPNGTGKSFIVLAVMQACSGMGISEEDIYQESGQRKPNKEASIALEWHDGRRLELRRKSGVTSWTIIQPDGNYEQLNGVADKGIIKRIRDFSGWKPLTIGSSEEYLQLAGLGKHNLLISDATNQAVLKVINGLAGGGALEEAVRQAKSDFDRHTQLIAPEEARLADLRRQRLDKGLTKTEALLVRARKVKKAEQDIASMRQTMRGLASARQTVGQAGAKAVALSQRLERARAILATWNQTEAQMQGVRQSAASCVAVAGSIHTAANSIRTAQSAIEAARAEQIQAAEDLSAWVQTAEVGPRELCGQCGNIRCKAVQQ